MFLLLLESTENIDDNFIIYLQLAPSSQMPNNIILWIRGVLMFSLTLMHELGTVENPDYGNDIASSIALADLHLSCIDKA